MTRIGSHHAEWLGLLEVSGPFLSLPVLERVFPQGLDSHDSDHASKLRLAREEWVEEQRREEPDPEIHDLWIDFVLSETLEYSPAVLHKGSSLGSDFGARIEEHDEILRPEFVLASPDAEPTTSSTRLLIVVHPVDQDLEETIASASWAASPIARMTHLCRAVGVRLGLVTNGERWVLIDAPRGETAAHVSWYASLWSLEPLTLRAFRSLLGVRRFFGVADSETLEGMLAESVSYQAEVTEQLGAQVRRAVEVLVQALDRADTDSGRKLLSDVSESELYEAALTVMMRLVFLFFAEENDLLPLGDRFYQENYAASTLQGQLRAEANRVGVEVLERRQDAWTRLLSTFRAIYGGIEHEALRLPPYGGSLFDPDRFCFLEGRPPSTTWQQVAAEPLPVDNRTVLHLLDALQTLQMRGRAGVEARKLSFRGLDIEQIGHVYEMLLDHEVVRAASAILGLVGARGQEPEVAVEQLDALRAKSGDALLDFLQKKTGKSRPALSRLLEKDPEPGWVQALRTVCRGDEELLNRILPYHSVIRTDPWGEPIVIQPGSVFVTGGTERRSTGTYYTPRALTEEVVTHALEPVVYAGASEGKPRQEWKLKRPEEILELKVCDLAMGSGAFLVQVIRWLSERLVEAWDDDGRTTNAITTEDQPTRDVSSKMMIPTEPEERAAFARRLIADRCIYGVDVNPLAVEMAKLSLWLVTLAKGRPFSFLDHALKCGDSLLGVHELDQIRNFHLDPARGEELHATLFDPTHHIERVVQDALDLRRELESFTVRDVRDAEQKAELNHRANDALNRLRLLGDLIVGAAILTAGQGGDAFDNALKGIADRLPSMFDAPGTEVDESLLADALAMLNEGKPPLKTNRRTFHWPLEFPEVFGRERGGFDAIVGNPPFAGGKKISGALGTRYREYLVEHVASGRKGNADLVAYFFLRSAMVVRTEGTFGLLGTNTISQGDTREVGLDQLLEDEWNVVRAYKSRTWPGDASIQIAVVWLYHGSWLGDSSLDGSVVESITSTLDPRSRASGKPLLLAENSGRGFQGSNLNGIGFVVTREEAERLINEDARNQEVLYPFLNGEDLNTSPTQSASRWVINFFDWPLSKAEEYPGPLEIVRERVKPHRDSLDDRKKRVRENWWKYEVQATALYESIRNFERAIAIALTSRTLIPCFTGTDMVYSHALGILAYDDAAHLGVVSSSFHWWWVVKHGSTMRMDVRYTIKDCFETFPQPPLGSTIEGAATELEEFRRKLMIERDAGLTKIYNRVHSPDETSADMARLRDLHVNLDRAVAGAYGWEDLALDHDFYETPQGVRYTLGPIVRTEMLDRLLELNHERYAEENQQLSLSAVP